MPDYSPLLDPWYGPTGNGPSASPPITAPGGNVDLSGIEDRLAALETRVPVYVHAGDIPDPAPSRYVLLEGGTGNGGILITVDDGVIL